MVALITALIILFQRGSNIVFIVVDFDVPNEMSEDETKSLTCTADDTNHPAGLGSLRIIQQLGSGVLAPDSDPDPKVVVRVYDPNEGGKSRTANFICIARPVSGQATNVTGNIIVRDAQEPVWNPAVPAIPALGADGNPAGKISIPFQVTLSAKDDGLPAIRGAESGIYQLILSPVTNRVTVTPSNGVYTTPNTIPPGFPDGNSGPLNDSQTFDATCTSQGIAVIPATASDAAGNEVVRPLQIECYP